MPSLLIDGYALPPDKAARMDEGNRVLDRLRASRRRRVAVADCSGIATWTFDSYLQLLLHRVVSLGDGIATEWNARRVVNSAILTRSLMESVGAWWYLLDRSERLLDAGDLRGAHALAVKAEFGVRYGHDGEAAGPKATHVLDLVRALEKAFPKMMHFYDAISEMVHPNYDAVFLFGEVTNERELILDEHQAAREVVATGKILFGLLLFELFEACCSVYRDRIRPKLSVLEGKFGPNPSGWPGQPDPEVAGQ